MSRAASLSREERADILDGLRLLTRKLLEVQDPWSMGKQLDVPIDWDKLSRVYRLALRLGNPTRGGQPSHDYEPSWLGYRVLRQKNLSIPLEISKMSENLRSNHES